MKDGFDDLVNILTHPWDDLFNALLVICLVGPLTDLYFNFGPITSGMPFITFLAQLLTLIVLFVNLGGHRYNAKTYRRNMLSVTVVLAIVAVIWFWIMLHAYARESDVGLVIVHSPDDSGTRESLFELEACWVFMFVTLTSLLGTIAMIRNEERY